MTNVPAAKLDRLAGLVERVTFHNEQNGFCVLRLKVKGADHDPRCICNNAFTSLGRVCAETDNWIG